MSPSRRLVPRLLSNQRRRLGSLQPGERLLAWAASPSGAVIGGSRDALHLPGDLRLPWEEVATVEWDVDERELHVVEVGVFGQPQPEHRLTVDDPDRLLSLVRERVTASIVVQRDVTVRDRLGARVIGRRAPGRPGPIAWFVDYDAGLDPDDPAVAAVVDTALASARGDAGE